MLACLSPLGAQWRKWQASNRGLIGPLAADLGAGEGKREREGEREGEGEKEGKRRGKSAKSLMGPNLMQSRRKTAGSACRASARRPTTHNDDC